MSNDAIPLWSQMSSDDLVTMAQMSAQNARNSLSTEQQKTHLLLSSVLAQVALVRATHETANGKEPE